MTREQAIAAIKVCFPTNPCPENTFVQFPLAAVQLILADAEAQRDALLWLQDHKGFTETYLAPSPAESEPCPPTK
jgi:hypothetical protein